MHFSSDNRHRWREMHLGPAEEVEVKLQGFSEPKGEL